MFEFIKSKSFHTIASFILGFGLIAVLRPGCGQGSSCTILKAPPLEEVAKSTYQLGQKCYQFRSEATECAASGVVEPFMETRAL